MPETKLDPKLRWGLQFASGYLNLGMPDEALNELTRLKKDFQTLPEVMSLKGQIFLLRSEWSSAAELAQAGHDRYPELPDFYIQQALAYEQLGEPARAIDIWMSAPEAIKRSGFCHYNLARCQARLGNTSSARRHAQQAVKLEPLLKPAVKTDPLLSALKSPMGGTN